MCVWVVPGGGWFWGSGQLSLMDLEGAGGTLGPVAAGLDGVAAESRGVCAEVGLCGLERGMAGLLGDGMGRTTAEISLRLRVRKQAVTDALQASPGLFCREPGGLTWA